MISAAEPLNNVISAEYLRGATGASREQCDVPRLGNWCDVNVRLVSVRIRSAKK